MDQIGYIGNKYKVKSVLLSLTVTFIIVIIIPIVLYLTNSPLLQIGGDLLLRLTRIAFILLATPIAIITLFIGHRIDNASNKTVVYPLFVELMGLIIGLILGLGISLEWSFLLTLSLGTIWADPFLYAPFPIFTSLITYLCFKGAQFIYSITKKTVYKQSFFIPLVFFIFSLPVLLYSAFALFSLLKQEYSQSTITLTHVKEIPTGNVYQITATLTVPETNLYHITALAGSSSHPTSALALRLNGIANIDGLYNFELHKGSNALSYIPNQIDCGRFGKSSFQTTFTISVAKMLADRFAMGQPNTITQTIVCTK